MEDRYLFKAKRTDNGEWVEGYLVETRYNTYHDGYRIIDKDGINYDELDYYEPSFISYVIDKSTICQCTGLKDKNGKLIWENDIVRDDNGNIYKAFWQDRYYQFSWICVKSDKLPIGAKWDFWSIRNYEIEVIGNIFDNKELLESEEKE